MMYQGCASMHGGVVGQGGALEEAPSKEPTVTFTIRTRYSDGGFFFEGVGEGLEGERNPTLNVEVGEYVG